MHLLLRPGAGRCAAAADVLVRRGRIQAIGPDLSAPDVRQEEGDGALLLPGLVEAHAHLDKTLWGLPWYVNEVGTRLEDKIANERRWRRESGHDAGRQSLRLALEYLARGATRLRTHVDIDTDAGLRHLHPAGIDGDATHSLDVLFGLAVRCGKPLDIHLHEAGEAGAATLDAILDRTGALGLQGRVAISHCFCLGDVGEPRRGQLLERMARLQVAVITTGTASRPVPPLLACRAAGVAVAGGNDGIRDTWTPYGQPDMLERAMLIGLRNNLRRDDELAIAFETVTSRAASVCGFAGYGLDPGCRADFVLVRAHNVQEAVVARPVRQLVVSGGAVVAREGVLVASATGSAAS